MKNSDRSIILAKTSFLPQSLQELWQRSVWSALGSALIPLSSRRIWFSKGSWSPDSLLLFAYDTFPKYEQCPFLTTVFESTVLKKTKNNIGYGQLMGQGGIGLFLWPPGDGSEYAEYDFFPLYFTCMYSLKDNRSFEDNWAIMLSFLFNFPFPSLIFITSP